MEAQQGESGGARTGNSKSSHAIDCKQPWAFMPVGNGGRPASPECMCVCPAAHAESSPDGSMDSDLSTVTLTASSG